MEVTAAAGVVIDAIAARAAGTGAAEPGAGTTAGAEAGTAGRGTGGAAGVGSAGVVIFIGSPCCVGAGSGSGATCSFSAALTVARSRRVGSIFRKWSTRLK